MRTVHLALAAAFEFAWKCGAVVITFTLLAMMASKTADYGLSDPVERGSTQYLTMTGSEAVQVRLKPADGECSSNCTLMDERGRRLLEVAYNRFGCLCVRWGDAFPVRPCCSASRDGRYYFVAMEGTNCYELSLQQNGVSGVMVTDIGKGARYGAGYTREGELVVEPWEVGAVPGEEIGPSGNQAVAARSSGRRASASRSSEGGFRPGSIVSRTSRP